jgi:hypothetical protein
MTRLQAVEALWTSPFVVIVVITILAAVVGCFAGEQIERMRRRRQRRRNGRPAGRGCAPSPNRAHRAH